MQCFSMVFEGPEDSFWMTLGVLLGFSAVLGASWALGGRLGGVLGVSGSAKER